MKVNNSKTKVKESVKLNDQDLMNRVLSCLKELTKNYTVALTEFSNENLYRLFKKDFDRISQMQRDTFELMFKNGWYIMEAQDKNKVSTSYSTLKKSYDSLNK